MITRGVGLEQHFRVEAKGKDGGKQLICDLVSLLANLVISSQLNVTQQQVRRLLRGSCSMGVACKAVIVASVHLTPHTDNLNANLAGLQLSRNSHL